MAPDILQNQSDATQRVVEIFLEFTDGTGYTGSTSGFTIKYRKPGSGTDTTKTLTADGADGRFLMQLTQAETDTDGAGWVKVIDPGNTIIPYIDGVRIVAETPDVVAILADVVALTTSVATLTTSVGTLTTNLAALDARIPNALVSGNLKTIVEAYASGQAPLQPSTTGHTLQVSAAGNTGIDWAHVENPTTSVNLSATTVGVVTALATAAYNATRDAILAAVVDAGGSTPSTVKGVLYRMNAFMRGHAAGLLSSVYTFFANDGTTKAFEATQDTSAGTRVTASTVTGD